MIFYNNHNFEYIMYYDTDNDNFCQFDEGILALLSGRNINDIIYIGGNV